jgi:hypothetical protein
MPAGTKTYRSEEYCWSDRMAQNSIDWADTRLRVALGSAFVLILLALPFVARAYSRGYYYGDAEVDSAVSGFLVLCTIAAVLLALIPAIVAAKKGHSFYLSWFFGFVLFIVALPCALMVGEAPYGKKQSWSGAEEPNTKECPQCGENVRFRAKTCRFCGHNFSVPERELQPENSSVTSEASGLPHG